LVVESFRVTPTNRWYRAPVTVVLRPVITGGHPRDRIMSYDWTVDGQAPERPFYSSFYATFEEPGVHHVNMTVTTKGGRTATGTLEVNVAENQLPVCELTYNDSPTMKVTRIDGSCSDPDGRIRSYTLDLGDGTSVNNRYAYARYVEGGAYTVVLTATDDSGGVSSLEKEIMVER
jgi:PKD repeat protein